MTKTTTGRAMMMVRETLTRDGKPERGRSGRLASRALLSVVAAAAACGAGTTSSSTSAVAPPTEASSNDPAVSSSTPNAACGGSELRVSFYDVGQGLAVLVELPDGRHVLVDTGEAPRRAGCGAACKERHQHVMARLAADLGDAPIDLLWITHPHSDHVGGAVDVLDHFLVHSYVDNGRDLTKSLVQKAREAAQAHDVPVTAVGPGSVTVPMPNTDEVTFTAIAPATWSAECRVDANLCSIGLRIDYCASSILFTGDAEVAEESALVIGGPVTLLQVGHHGSDTSSSAALLEQAGPKYAVLSAGHPGEGTNRTYCHPRATTVETLTARLGGAGSRTIRAFSSASHCDVHAPLTDWSDVGASDRLWATSRDGDVVLTTTGDGSFARQ